MTADWPSSSEAANMPERGVLRMVHLLLDFFHLPTEWCHATAQGGLLMDVRTSCRVRCP